MKFQSDWVGCYAFDILSQIWVCLKIREAIPTLLDHHPNQDGHTLEINPPFSRHSPFLVHVSKTRFASTGESRFVEDSHDDYCGSPSRCLCEKEEP